VIHPLKTNAARLSSKCKFNGLSGAEFSISMWAVPQSSAAYLAEHART